MLCIGLNGPYVVYRLNVPNVCSFVYRLKGLNVFYIGLRGPNVVYRLRGPTDVYRLKVLNVVHWTNFVYRLNGPNV